MGRRNGPDARDTSVGQKWRTRLLPCTCAVIAGLLACAATEPARAQADAATPADQTAAKPKDRLLVEAKTLVYNRDTNVVTAEGNVQLYYQGRTLEADKVIYNRGTNRVFAEGNAKITEADGSVTYGQRFELSDDFRNGFVDSLSTITKEKTYFTSPRAERAEGETAVFDKGTYTACAPCQAHPERPPFWQIKAMKIVHKAEEQTIYFEDATLELLGVPIAYVPYFSTPDPTVTRKTGFLAPHYVYESRLGHGAAIPFFWNLAPNYDLTLTPTPLSRQGVLGQVEWRHRLMNGSYSIRATGIEQLDPTAFAAKPYGTGNRSFRGSIESTGQFYINQNWKTGWDLAFFTDKYYFQDYNVRSDSMGADYIKESISTAYLIGQGDRSYFDIRGYRIIGLSQFDYNKQQPLVHPVLDYNRTFTVDPAKTAGVGGEIKLDFNLTSLSRTAADYQSAGIRLLDPAYSLYNYCPTSPTPVPGQPNFKPPSCFLSGIAGDYTRASVQASWQTRLIDPIGEVWKPFAFARADGSWLNLNTTDTFTFANNTQVATLSNADQLNFVGMANNDLSSRFVPGVGLEYRYPFVAKTDFATHTFEPIAQIIARPNVAHSGTTPNEDAQSLVFDDTTLFAWNKYSGYDRIEGGTRANVGVEYSANLVTGGYANALFGQSYQLAGANPYSLSDISNVGLQSGLQDNTSDYVARAIFSPNSNFALITKGRFDHKDFTPQAVDLIGTYKLGNFSGAAQYSSYAPQPLVGYPNRREGVLVSSRFDFLDHYYVSGTATLELNPTGYDTVTKQYDLKLGHPQLAVLGAGVGYSDDCTTLSVNYSRSYTNAIGVQSVNQTVLLQLTLRTLADVKLQQNLGATSTVQDGVFK